MKKKLFYFFIAVSSLIGIFYFYLPKSHLLLSEEFCAFCDTEILNSQKFYEDDLVIALFTHKPILPGHCLIIPKRHVERFEMLSEKEITQIGRVIKKVNLASMHLFKTHSYLLLQKNGLEAGQSVPHVHFHYISREKGDDSILKFLVRMYLSNIQKPIPREEMQKMVDKMKATMESYNSSDIPLLHRESNQAVST